MPEGTPGATGAGCQQQALIEAARELLGDNRCDRCGWTMAESDEDGCVPWSCSQRPLPALNRERAYARALLEAHDAREPSKS